MLAQYSSGGRLAPPPVPQEHSWYLQRMYFLNLIYEDDIKIVNKYVAGLSRTIFLYTKTTSRPPTGYPFKWINNIWLMMFSTFFSHIFQNVKCIFVNRLDRQTICTYCTVMR
jgi:hypothetical protein